MAKIENLENNRVKLTFEVSPEDFSAALVDAYRKTGKRYSVPGFRKGKLAPKKMIETYYGESVFFEEAFELLYNELVPAAIGEADAYPTEPQLDMTTISKEEGLTFSATFEKNPYLNLGEYKGIELKKTDYTVHKKDVQEELDRRLQKIKNDHARLVSVERPVENGDTVDLDYSGSVDGVKFEGGTAENQNLEIGSGSFIPGFESQMIGMALGEQKDITVTFPEEYHAENLAGKEAVFAVKVNSISAKEYPEMNDEFASEISEFDTMEEFEKSIRKEIEKEMKAQSEQKKLNDATTKAIEASESFIPSAMINEQAEAMARDSMQRFGAYGMDLHDFCKAVGINAEEFIGSFKENAEMRIKSELLLGKIAEAENIELSDEELESEAKVLVESYSMDTTTEDDKKKMLDMLLNEQRTVLNYQLRMQKAQDILKANIVMK